MPKIPKKKASVNRSRAAKNGWETRRANAAKRNDSAPKERAKQSKSKGSASNRADKLARDAAKLKRERANLEAAKKAFRAEQKRERASLRKAETKESRALKKAEALKAAAVKKLEAALSDMKAVEDIVTNMAQKGVPVSAILGPFEDNPEATQRIKELIVQARLDMSAAAYNDVRWDAFDLAEELDWDISDVYDAWNYDEPSA